MAADNDPQLYRGWRVERWETPASDARSLRLVSLVDAGALEITLEDAGDPNRRRWRFTFSDAPAYLNLREEYRLELSAEGITADKVGWTLLVPNSPWLDLLRRAEPLLDVHHPILSHFQIGTEDDVIDVLSSAAPRIEEVEPADPNSPPAGRSNILFWPTDRERIDREIQNTKTQQEP
jgi:hypothetical protein